MSATVQKIECVGGPVCGAVYTIDTEELPNPVVPIVYYGGTAKYKLREDDQSKADYVEG